MPSPRTKARLPVEPFRKWIEKRIAHYAAVSPNMAEASPLMRLSFDLGVSERTLSRWRTEVGEVHRSRVEEALFRAGTFLWELYPELPEFADGPVETKWCDKCREKVFVDDYGRCLWCPPGDQPYPRKRAEVEPRYCTYCGDEIPRYVNGRRRPPVEYRRAKFCCLSCSTYARNALVRERKAAA